MKLLKKLSTNQVGFLSLNFALVAKKNEIIYFRAFVLRPSKVANLESTIFKFYYLKVEFFYLFFESTCVLIAIIKDFIGPFKIKNTKLTHVLVVQCRESNCLFYFEQNPS
jgi:hypothetical protein